VPQARRNILAQLRQTFDVAFVDNGVFPGDVGTLLAPAPVEVLVDDDGFRHTARVVTSVERQICAWAARAIAEMGITPHQASGEPLRIWIEQQLVVIEPVTAFWFVRTVGTITIELAGRNIVQIAVPDILGAFGKRDPFDLPTAMVVEQAELDLFGMCRKQREIRSAAIPTRAETDWRSL
jgi:hypothetical protein